MSMDIPTLPPTTVAIRKYRLKNPILWRIKHRICCFQWPARVLLLCLQLMCFIMEERNKEAPAIIKSYYDKRIVGCPGGEGEDEHHVVLFWLEKGKPHECPVCTQYFELEVVWPRRTSRWTW